MEVYPSHSFFRKIIERPTFTLSIFQSIGDLWSSINDDLFKAERQCPSHFFVVGVGTDRTVFLFPSNNKLRRTPLVDFSIAFKNSRPTGRVFFIWYFLF